MANDKYLEIIIIRSEGVSTWLVIPNQTYENFSGQGECE